MGENEKLKEATNLISKPVSPKVREHMLAYGIPAKYHSGAMAYAVAGKFLGPAAFGIPKPHWPAAKKYKKDFIKFAAENPPDNHDHVPVKTPPQDAHRFLQRATELLGERGKDYDKEQERSGAKIAAAFNAITGYNLGAAEVYLLLQIVKDVRQWTAPVFHRDSAEDSVAYAALKSEALAGGV